MCLIGEVVSAIPAEAVCKQATKHQEQRKHGQRQERAVHELHLRGIAVHQRKWILRAAVLM